MCVFLFAQMLPMMRAQEDTPVTSPSITLYLPPDTASEGVQINYFRFGAFGAYGGYVTAEKGRTFYEIPASVEGKAASMVKIIAYLPGCEIAKFEVTMQGVTEARTLVCKALGSVPLHGMISPATIAEIQGTKVEISYQAHWDHAFFGIADGAVTAIRVASVIPGADGRFEADLPDFFRQKDLGKASFRLLLRDTATGNIIAFLQPEGIPRFWGLDIRSSYAPFVRFSADSATPASNNADSQNSQNF